MISQENIKKLSTRLQANPGTIAREYVQHNFLSELYRQSGSDRVLFKGGTALRIIFASPRFSEDLDFTAQKNISYKEIENLLEQIYYTLDSWGFRAEIKEAKKTTGGYLAKTIFSFYDYEINLKIEISFRTSRSKALNEISQIKNYFIPVYDIIHEPSEQIVAGKIAALMARSKPRDWYDLYFLLKNGYLGSKEKKQLLKILKKFKRYQGNISKELKMFLPVNHQLVLKDFKNLLINEIEKYI